jgi:hypothetical protein
MTQTEFVKVLEEELKLRGLAFSRADVLEFVDDVWPLAKDDPDPVRWAERFLEAGFGDVKA